MSRLHDEMVRLSKLNKENDMHKTAIGAWALIKWNSDDIHKPATPAYFSFMGINEDDDGSGDPAECDKAGVPDDYIFFFADDGVAEMDAMMLAPSKTSHNDFTVVSYKVVYMEIKNGN